jgi:hypothetical protein
LVSNLSRRGLVRRYGDTERGHRRMPGEDWGFRVCGVFGDRIKRR